MVFLLEQNTVAFMRRELGQTFLERLGIHARVLLQGCLSPAQIYSLQRYTGARAINERSRKKDKITIPCAILEKLQSVSLLEKARFAVAQSSIFVALLPQKCAVAMNA
jgi:hypothetical protein